MLVYDPRKTCFAPGCLEWEIQKFLASGKLTDIISTLPPEQLVRVTARAVEGQAEVEWKGPLTLANKQLAIERHNARCSKTNYEDLRHKDDERRTNSALGRHWRRAILAVTRLPWSMVRLPLVL